MIKSKKNYTNISDFFILKKKISKRRLERFFSLIRIDSTFKTTSNNRMPTLNIKLKNYVKKFFSQKILVCDIGISSGQTTLELYKALNKKKLDYIYGFDKQIYIKLYKFKKLLFLFSLKNELLMVEFKGYCFRYRYFILLKKIEKLLSFLLKVFDVQFKKSTMLIPDLEKISKIKFVEQDIFRISKDFYNFFDVVRVSNLLNYAYFSERKLKIAINNIRKITKENSIILINRTTRNNKHLASFFIKTKGKFYLLEDINGGPEIKKIMLQ